MRQLGPHPLAVERVAHEPPAEDEEVVERQPPGPSAALRLGQGEAGQLVTEAADDGLDHRVERRRQALPSTVRSTRPFAAARAAIALP